MSAENLLQAFDCAREDWLLRAEKRRETPKPQKKTPSKPVQKTRPKNADWANSHIWLPLVACFAAVILALWLVPWSESSQQTRPQLSESEEIHVIFHSYDQIDQLLLQEYTGDDLETWLKEQGLYSQGIRTEADVAWVAERIHSIPIPRLRGLTPQVVELSHDMPTVYMGFPGISMYIPWVGGANMALPEGVQVSTDPLLILTEQLEQKEGYLFRFALGHSDRIISLSVEADSLEEALQMLEGLEFDRFDGDLVGMSVRWTLDGDTLHLHSLANNAAVHGFLAPWADRAELISHVEVEEGITYLGPAVLQELSALQSITLPRSLTFIGSDNLRNCGLTHVAVPQNVAYLGAGFGSGSALRSVILRPKQLSPVVMLSECADLAYVQFAGSREAWEAVAAQNPQLKSLAVLCAADALAGEGWQTYGTVQWRLLGDTLALKGEGGIGMTAEDSYPWYDLRDRVKHLVLDEGITGTHPNVFPFPKLQDVYLPASLTDIGNLLLAECTDLPYVLLPEYVTELPNGLFWQCKKLAYVAIPGGVTEIGSSAFSDCRSLETLQLPHTLRFVGDSAFFGCASLRELRLPQGLRQLRTGLFYDCKSLARLWLPETVRSVDASVFYGCEALTEIHFAGSRTQWDAISFHARSGFKGSMTVHCAGADPVVPLIDTWVGSYQNGGYRVEHTQSAQTDVELSIQRLEIDHNADTHFGCEGELTLFLKSDRDQTVILRLQTAQSDDNGCTLLQEQLHLTKDQLTQCPPLRFEGWADHAFDLTVEVGNTRLILTVYPPVEE